MMRVTFNFYYQNGSPIGSYRTDINRLPREGESITINRSDMNHQLINRIFIVDNIHTEYSGEDEIITIDVKLPE